MTDNLTVVYRTYFADDKDRDEYVPDELKAGVNKFIEDEKIGVVFDFLSKYVRKLYADSHIREQLKKEAGLTFIEILTPSDKAYVVTILKNAKDVWDQKLRVKQPNYKNKKKVYHLFTNGRGQKRVLGQSVWSDDGKKYYEEAVKNWDAVYLDDSLMGDLVEGWDEWLKANGADERVNDVEVGVLGRKDLYDVIGTWSENDADNAHRRRGRKEARQKVKQPSDKADASDDEEQFYYSDGERDQEQHEDRE